MTVPPYCHDRASAPGDSPVTEPPENSHPAPLAVVSHATVQSRTLPDSLGCEPPAPIIRLEGIHFRYEGQPPLFQGLSFQLCAGEKVGIIGANGTGKTTFLLMLMGLVQPQSGTIEIFGRVRTRPADFEDLPGKIGLLFQNSDDQLFCPTVAEDVAFGPFNQGKTVVEVRQIVRHTLAELGLEGWENRITYRLSGGEKRLVALATVLAMDPQILLLDEPTAGLDASASARVEGALGRLPQAMIIISHDRDFLERLCHRILVLQEGIFLPYPKENVRG
ncbi:ABC transporter ATP-binding protein [Thermogutta sp.]|uniref:energy-coupling factor ABC transporter ATP-binding protein n=1 Tax=Thermogutta sp. TaxID=1962930 RepID=UPI00322037DB